MTLRRFVPAAPRANTRVPRPVTNYQDPAEVPQHPARGRTASNRCSTTDITTSANPGLPESDAHGNVKPSLVEPASVKHQAAHNCQTSPCTGHAPTPESVTSFRTGSRAPAPPARSALSGTPRCGRRWRAVLAHPDRCAWVAAAPATDCPDSVRRLKTALRRFAIEQARVLTRRSESWLGWLSGPRQSVADRVRNQSARTLRTARHRCSHPDTTTPI